MGAADTFMNTSRVYPRRDMGLPQKSVNASGKKLLGYTNQAELIVGTGNAQFILTAGYQVPGSVGNSLTLTINAASGSLTVTSNGFDISVTPASGGSHASAVVAAINAQFPAPSPITGPTIPGQPFVLAALTPSSTGGSNVATLAKTNFSSDQRSP